MASLSTKERKMIKYIRKSKGASEESLKLKFGEEYLETLNSISDKGLIERKLAEDQSYFKPNEPPGNLIPNAPKGNYVLVDDKNKKFKDISSKGNKAKFVIEWITVILTSITAVIAFIQLFCKK